MSVLTPEYEDRLYHWIHALKRDLYRPIRSIDWEAFFTMDYLSLETAKKQLFHPVSPGLKWGHSWEYCWLHGTVTIPEEAAGKRINLDACLGGEATIFVNDQAFGTYRADWIDEAHHYIEDNTLTREAVPGTVYDIYIELYAGHWFPRNVEREGNTVTGPVMEGDFADPYIEGERHTLGTATFGVWNETAYQLYMDVSILKSLLEILDPDSLRAVKVADALEQFTLTVDFEQEQEGRIRDYAKARELLAPVLSAHNGSTVPKFYAIGNAHIDLAWLWPMQETYRKIARTLGAQLRHLEEYPEYQYIHSQPAAFEMCKKYYPELFARIKDAVKEGRFLVEGAMWVEPDTNLTSGESLIRQLYYGINYYKSEFGVDSEVLWLPDSFGYSAALPQLLNNFDVKYLVTQKIFWSYNAGEAFPYHYFTWEGMDGSHIDTFLPTSYIYRTTPVEANKVWRKRSQRKDLEAFLFPYGYGDGGGGPCRDHIEYAKRSQHLEGNVEMKFAGPNEFFHDMEALGGPKHRYVGELYFTAHRGTYTVQAKVKKYNRKSELLMRELEFWGALSMLTGHTYPEEEAREWWKTILLHQFHDILPGSCIGRVYQEAYPIYETLFAQVEARLQSMLSGMLTRAGARVQGRGLCPGPGLASGAGACVQGRGLCPGPGLASGAGDSVSEERRGGVTVFNSLCFARNSVVNLPDSFAEGAYCQGKYIPVYQGIHGFEAVVDLPSCGAISLIPAGKAENNLLSKIHHPSLAEKNSNPISTDFPVIAYYETSGNNENNIIAENSKARFVINRKGEVTSFRLKKEDGSLCPREYAQGPMNHFLLYKDVPRKYDAWDIDSNYILQEIPNPAQVDSIELLQDHGARIIICVKGKISNSTFCQRICLQAESTRLEFHTQIHWQEKHRLLKAAFPVNVYTQNGINEIQFGYAERPTHRSKVYDQQRFEVCNHRYTALAEANHGAAVLNDCKYGVSMNDHSIELTLLRAATCPDPDADRGDHTFTYAITAWEGSFMDSDVVEQGYELNVAPLVSAGITASTFSAFSLDAPNIILETVKPAFDQSGDLVLRLYESKKADTYCALNIDLTTFGFSEDSYTLLECDMAEHEKEIADAACLHFHPFEVKTLRLHFHK